MFVKDIHMLCYLCLREIEKEVNFLTFFNLNRDIFCRSCLRSNNFNLVHETFPTAENSVCNLYYFEKYNPEIPEEIYLQFFSFVLLEKTRMGVPIFFLLEYNEGVENVLKKVFKTDIIILSLRKVGTDNEH